MVAEVLWVVSGLTKCNSILLLNKPHGLNMVGLGWALVNNGNYAFFYPLNRK